MATSSAVTGFKTEPMGFICERRWNLTADLAYSHERARNYHKDWHTHDRLMLVCPLGASRVELRLRGEQEPYSVDAASVLWLRPHHEHQTAAGDGLYDSLALYPSDALIKTVIHELGTAHPCAEHPAVKLKRDPCLAALLQLFLKAAVRATRSRSHLELQALSCLIMFTTLRSHQEPDTSDPQTDSSLLRVMAAIDADIARPWTLSELAKQGYVSPSTMARLFRTKLGISPMAYVQEARLREAESLLRRGTAVSESARIVGYQSPSAFCCAYRKRFGRSPSHVWRL